jgi:glutathione S-transferase
VEIPRLPPKPDLTPLTGGYRLTPVMQIGADVFCDSQCILRELQRRFPEPTFFPGAAAGLAWGASRWTDGALFKACIAIVFGAQARELPEAFAADRGRLYFGQDFQLGRLERDLVHTLAQVRAQLAWIDERLGGGDPFIAGDLPGLPDALCYYLVWFLRGRYAGGPSLLEQFPALLGWEERVRAIGHGSATGMSATQALEVARRALPETPRVSHEGADPQGLAPGMQVAVSTESDDGTGAVEGEIAFLDMQEVAIARAEVRVGDVVVHFPRVGYRIEPR